MSQVIKTSVTLLLICFGVIILTSIGSANIQATDARRMHTDIINEIENGNLSDTVVSECAARAADAGYVLETTAVSSGEGERIMVEVLLKYTYKVPVLNISGTTHEIHGYAR